MTEWGIDTLFNPGKRHMDEEKRRLQSAGEEVGDASGGRRIDLESGTVTISRRGKSAPASTEAADSEQDTQRSDQTNPEEAEPASKDADARTEDARTEDARTEVDGSEGPQKGAAG